MRNGAVGTAHPRVVPLPRKRRAIVRLVVLVGILIVAVATAFRETPSLATIHRTVSDAGPAGPLLFVAPFSLLSY